MKLARRLPLLELVVLLGCVAAFATHTGETIICPPGSDLKTCAHQLTCWQITFLVSAPKTDALGNPVPERNNVAIYATQVQGADPEHCVGDPLTMKIIIQQVGGPTPSSPDLGERELAGTTTWPGPAQINGDLDSRCTFRVRMEATSGHDGTVVDDFYVGPILCEDSPDPQLSTILTEIGYSPSDPVERTIVTLSVSGQDVDTHTDYGTGVTDQVLGDYEVEWSIEGDATVRRGNSVDWTTPRSTQLSQSYPYLKSFLATATAKDTGTASEECIGTLIDEDVEREQSIAVFNCGGALAGAAFIRGEIKQLKARLTVVLREIRQKDGELVSLVSELLGAQEAEQQALEQAGSVRLQVLDELRNILVEVNNDLELKDAVRQFINTVEHSLDLISLTTANTGDVLLFLIEIVLADFEDIAQMEINNQLRAKLLRIVQRTIGALRHLEAMLEELIRRSRRVGGLVARIEDVQREINLLRQEEADIRAQIQAKEEELKKTEDLIESHGC